MIDKEKFIKKEAYIYDTTTTIAIEPNEESVQNSKRDYELKPNEQTVELPQTGPQEDLRRVSSRLTHKPSSMNEYNL